MAYVQALAAGEEGTIGEINMTPLVDVLLVVLVVLMVGMPTMTRTWDVPIQPSSREQTVRTEPLRLQIDAAGAYRLDGVEVARAALPQALATAAQGMPKASLVVATAGDSDYQALAGAFAAAEAAAIADIALQTNR